MFPKVNVPTNSPSTASSDVGGTAITVDPASQAKNKNLPDPPTQENNNTNTPSAPTTEYLTQNIIQGESSALAPETAVLTTSTVKFFTVWEKSAHGAATTYIVEFWAQKFSRSSCKTRNNETDVAIDEDEVIEDINEGKLTTVEPVTAT